MSTVSRTCKKCQADLGEHWAIYIHCEDCEAERQRRHFMWVSIIFFPIWWPICMVGIVAGMVGSLLARGFRDGVRAVQGVANAWKGPKARKDGKGPQ